MARLGFFILVFAPCLPAAEEFTRLEITEKDFGPASDDWYGVYDFSGKKVGYARITATPPREESPYFEYRDRTKLNMSALGQTLTLESEEVARFDATPPYHLHEGVSTVTQNGEVKRIEIRRQERGYQARITEAGETRTLDFPDLDYRLTDCLSLEVWVRREPKAGDKITLREFFFDELETDLGTYTVKSVGQKIAGGVKLSLYEIGCHFGSTGDLGLLRCDAQGRMLSHQLGGLFEMRLEPEEKARTIEDGSDFFIFTTVKVDKPLGDPEDISELVLEASGEGLERIKPGPRQNVEPAEGRNTSLIKTGAGYGGKVPATREEVRKNLEESSIHPIRNSRVQRLVEEALGDARDPREKVRRLTAFVSNYLEDDIYAEPLTVLDILNRRKGACSEHSLLFTTLARAAGIPTREVAGLIYLGDEDRGFGYHGWNEVVLDGEWTPVDATWNETEVNATHIRYGDDWQSWGVIAATAGKLSFRVKDVQRKKKP